MPEPATKESDSSAAGPGESLPSIATGLSAKEVLERLDTAARRGRLAGFRPVESGAELFVAAAHGTPFDADLIGGYAAHPGGGSLEFRTELHRKMRVVFAVVLVATAWPGVYFMDELIAQYFESWWRPWVTYYWYLPLTILPIPWVWRSLMRKARATTTASARETIRKIAAELGGDIGATRAGL